MKETAENDELLIRYLLGELSDEEQEQIEQRYVDDREFYEQLLVVEDDLIDSYARGEMPESQRGKFENHFLRSPERAKRVEFAQALEALVAQKPQPVTSLPEQSQKKQRAGFFDIASWPVALRLAAAAVLIGAGVWLAIEMVNLRNRAERAESEIASLEQKRQELEQQAGEERRRNEELSAQLEEERNKAVEETPNQIPPEPQTSRIASITLVPGMVRGTGGTRQLIIQPGAEQVQLKVSFRQGDYKSYRAVIQNVEGREIFSRAGLKPITRGGSKTVNLTVPASFFSSADYILMLSGVTDEGTTEPVNQYYFPVTKK